VPICSLVPPRARAGRSPAGRNTKEEPTEADGIGVARGGYGECPRTDSMLDRRNVLNQPAIRQVTRGQRRRDQRTRPCSLCAPLALCRARREDGDGDLIWLYRCARASAVIRGHRTPPYKTAARRHPGSRDVDDDLGAGRNSALAFHGELGGQQFDALGVEFGT
jgi:hypothetical protein